jgi:tRNA(His) 5'-end guanylyltransferase
MKDGTDTFGERMKRYEGIETDRILMPKLPIYARLDGKSFHTFTKNMLRPYDKDMVDLMVDTTKYLVEKTNALIGYTSSDEISLAWYFPEPNSEPLFGGRICKITSVLSGMCSAYFAVNALKNFPLLVSKHLPSFDCRVINLPNKEEVANMFLWRESDATKNAISMASQFHFSHKELQGKTGPEMQEMLFQQRDVNFNDYPSYFKRGTFIKRIVKEVELTESQKICIPEKYRPNGKIKRSFVEEIDMPSFRKVINRVGVIFDNEEPKTL